MQNQKSENEHKGTGDCIVCGCCAFYNDKLKKYIHPQCEPRLHPLFQKIVGSFMPAQEVNDA